MFPLLARRRRAAPDPVVEELRQRLESLDNQCLANLQHGLAGMTNGDFTQVVVPQTTPITATSNDTSLQTMVELFNAMLTRTQDTLSSYNALREQLSAALGDQSCLDTLQDRLTKLNENCLTNLQVGLELMSSHGDLTKEVIPTTAPIVTDSGANAGRLADVFNAMLERAQGSLEAYNAMREDLRQTSEIVAAVAGGDLTVTIEPKSADDRLGNSVASLTGQLNELVGQVAQLATELTESSQEMARSSEEAGRAIGEIANAVSDVANGAERQVRTVESARRMTEEVAGATRDSAASADEATEAARHATQVASDGAAAVAQATEAMTGVRESSGQVTGAMGDLAHKSEQIGGIVDTITNIAEQTNLLALNAAIEAARAGDQGRGFAVVADEVRKLAEESQRAAASIGSLVQEIQKETRRATQAVQAGAARTEEGASTVEQARESFLRIGQSVEDMTDRVTRIASAVQQIADSSTQMQTDMTDVASVAEQSSASAQQVSASTQETTASAQEIAASAQDLARRAESLEEIVGRFTLASA